MGRMLSYLLLLSDCLSNHFYESFNVDVNSCANVNMEEYVYYYYYFVSNKSI